MCRSSLSALRGRAGRIVIPATAARAALHFTLRYGGFPGPGDVLILDLVGFDRLRE